MEILGVVFCGLGLFFIGFRMISLNLRQLTGSQFRQMIQRATGTRLLSVLTGFFSGMVSQSAVASVFITTGFYSAGFLGFSQALTIINWANIGTSVLIFFVVFNVKLLILYFIGLVGLAYFFQFDKTNRKQVLLQFMLGLALLFLGVVYIKNGAQQMQTLSWFRDALHMSSGSMILLFIAGIILTVIAQSGPTVSVVALTLCSVGLLNLFQSFVVVLGTGLGSAINILLLSARSKGSAKQLSIYQGIFKTTGAIGVALLIVIDHFWSGGHQPYSESLLSDKPAQQVAWLFLIMQLLPAILLTLLQKPVGIFLQRISPPVPAEIVSQPEFLYEPALCDTETALYLAGKEQLRLLRILPDYLVPVSPDRELIKVAEYQVLHDSFIAVEKQVSLYLETLANKPGTSSTQMQILRAQHFSALLRDLESNLGEFVATFNISFETTADQPIAINLTESLRLILETAVDFYGNPDAAGMDIMLSLTADKGSLLQKTRQEYFLKNVSDTSVTRQSIYTLSLLFERICWLLRLMSENKMLGTK